MKKLLSILTISTLTASVPAPLLANTVQIRVKRDVGATSKDVTIGFDIKIISKSNKWYKVDKNNLKNEFKQENNKWYILIYKKQIILKEKYNQKDKITISKFDSYEFLKFGKRNLQHFFSKPIEWSIYRWDGVGEPQTPIIDSNGNITDWNLKIKDNSLFQQGISFSLADGSKAATWSNAGMRLTVDGETNININNPNIEEVYWDGAKQKMLGNKVNINVKPETSDKNHKLFIKYDINGTKYTSEDIDVVMAAKIDPTPTPVQQNLSELIKTTDLGNIIDNNDDNIKNKIIEKKSLAIDFSQIKITNKSDTKATLSAIEGSKKDITDGLQIHMSNIKDLNLNWKSISGTFNEEFNVRNNKWYIMSARKPKTTDDFIIIKFKNNDIDKPFGNVWNNSVALDGKWYYVTELYRWEGVLEPMTLPLIDLKTGKVVNWNDITKFQQGISFSIADDKNGYWINPYQLVTNGQVKVKIANTDIETVKVNGKEMPQTNKVWEFDLPIDITTVENKDYQIEIAFKVDGKSYIGQIIVSSLLSQPSINVKKNTSVIGNVDSYVYQVPTNNKVGDITLTGDLYYSDTEVKVSLNKPTGSINITAQIFGLYEKWEKNKKIFQIFDNETHNLDGSQLETYQGRYLIEIEDNAKNKSSYYVVINKDNLTPNFWDTDQGQQFYAWASLNGYNESIKKLNANELNKIIKDSVNWQKLASDSQFATALVEWFKINDKLASKEPLTAEQVIAQLKNQIPNSITIPAVNTSNYDTNKVSFELNQSEFNPNDKVNITFKYNSATAEQFTLQIKENSTLDNNKKTGLGIWSIFEIVLGSLAGFALLGWLFKRFVVTPFILEPIRKKKAKAFAEKTEKDIAQMKKDDEEWEAKQRGDK